MSFSLRPVRFANAGEHAGAELLVVMEGKHEIRASWNVRVFDGGRIITPRES